MKKRIPINKKFAQQLLQIKGEKISQDLFSENLVVKYLAIYNIQTAISVFLKPINYKDPINETALKILKPYTIDQILKLAKYIK